MTIFEIAKGLPNGFHDSEIHTIHIDYLQQSLEITLDVWVGADNPPSELELYRRGNLSITGLQYCAMELPDQRYPYGEAYPLIIDLAEPTEFVPQAASFACRLWVNQWNGFIHLAAQAAELMWTGQPINRKHA